MNTTALGANNAESKKGGEEEREGRRNPPHACGPLKLFSRGCAYGLIVCHWYSLDYGPSWMGCYVS